MVAGSMRGPQTSTMRAPGTRSRIRGWADAHRRRRPAPTAVPPTEQTINGRSTPWIWSVVRFNLQSELDPQAIDHAIFPTYSLYEDGQLVATFPQANHEAFIALDATYQRLPSEIP